MILLTISFTPHEILMKPIIQGYIVSDLPHHLDTHRFMGPDGILSSILREVVEVLTEPLLIIYQQSWLNGVVQLARAWQR